MRIAGNLCPNQISSIMFSHHHDDAMRPPAVVTTMGKLKQQYVEPDWSPPLHQQQWHQQQPRGQVESREQYWGGNVRGGNSIIADERDTRMPMSNNFHYSATTMGRGGGQALSPRQHQYQQQIQMQQQHNSREMASYLAAIKAVNDSMSSDGRGSVTALRGLWKVFDAAVSELGTELNDSLSNKAIFEANVTQETLLRQGRKVTEFEKKSDALSRKKYYEAELKSTVLRLRGSFADVILGTKKELQNSIDKSFAVQTADIEKSFDMRLKEVAVDMEKSFTRKAIEAEKSFARKVADMEQAFAKKKAGMESSFAKKIESNRDSANIEIARLHNQSSQADQNMRMIQGQLGESEQAAHIAKHQLAQEREAYQQAIANVERSRDEAVTKLGSTLETLQNTCTSANSLEVQLHETEGKLRETEERLTYVQQERRQENDAANQQWSIENQRAGALQHKLDELVKNKNALINVQKEMEKHLGLERERGDLLQQHLDAETQSKQEVVASLQEADRQRRGELDRAYQANMHLKSDRDELQEENMHLKSEGEQLKSGLDRASQENMHLKSKGEQLKSGLDHASQDNMHLHEQLKRANEVGSSLKANLNGLQEKFEEQVEALHASKSEYSHLSDRLSKTSEMNSLLEAKVQDQVIDLEAARMSEADVERSLAESLMKGDELESKCRHSVETLELKLRRTVNELQTITEKLTDECRQKGEKIVALEEANNELTTLRRMTNELEYETSVLKDTLGRAESDYDTLQRLHVGLESETSVLKDTLGKVEEEYSQDRDKIANALAGFDEEISNAEAKLKSVLELNSQLISEKEALEKAFESKLSEINGLNQNVNELEKEKAKADDLEVKIKELTDAQEKDAGERATGEETIKKSLEDFASEKKHWEGKMSKVKEECKHRVSKYESDIGVYEEAIKMLQKQVEILEEMQLADSECETCTERAKTEQSIQEELEEEARLEFVSRINTQKLEHDSKMMNKNAEIASLREKCLRREESMKKLEKLCVKARKDLGTLKDQKSFLEGSSIRYIKDLQQSELAIDKGAADAIEVVATRSREGSVNVLDDVCAPLESAMNLNVPGPPNSLKDLGSELDALLATIEAQLGVGQCGALPNESQFHQTRGGRGEMTLATKSW